MIPRSARRKSLRRYGWPARLAAIGSGVLLLSGGECPSGDLQPCDFHADAGDDQTVAVGSLVQLAGDWGPGSFRGRVEFAGWTLCPGGKQRVAE
jgi:hypothetical protein